MTHKPSFLKSPGSSGAADKFLISLYQPLSESLATIGAILARLLVPAATALALAVPIAAALAPKGSSTSVFWVSAGVLFLVGLVGLLIGWIGSHDFPF